LSIKDALEEIIAEVDSIISGAEQNKAGIETSKCEETITNILPSFLGKIRVRSSSTMLTTSTRVVFTLENTYTKIT
jgi:hypothetical protein